MRENKNFLGEITEGKILLATILCYILGFFVLNAHLVKYGIFEPQSLMSYVRAGMCTLLFISPIILSIFLFPFAERIRQYLYFSFRDILKDKLSFIKESSIVLIINLLFSFILFLLYLIIIHASFGVYKEVSCVTIWVLSLLFSLIPIGLFVTSLPIYFDRKNLSQSIIKIIFSSLIVLFLFLFYNKIYENIPYQVGGGLYPFSKQFIVKSDKIKDLEGFDLEIDESCLMTDALVIIYENDSKVYVKNKLGKTIGINKDIFNGEVIIP